MAGGDSESAISKCVLTCSFLSTQRTIFWSLKTSEDFWLFYSATFSTFMIKQYVKDGWVSRGSEYPFENKVRILDGWCCRSCWCAILGLTTDGNMWARQTNSKKTKTRVITMVHPWFFSLAGWINLPAPCAGVAAGDHNRVVSHEDAVWWMEHQKSKKLRTEDRRKTSFVWWNHTRNLKPHCQLFPNS